VTTSLSQRLNAILPRITDPAFLSSDGIGNEIACYIFDYPAEHELMVRDHLGMLRAALADKHPQLEVLHLDLLDVIVRYIEHRGHGDRVRKIEQKRDAAGLLKALKGSLSAERLAAFIAEQHVPSDADLVLISGVGSAWPMVRAHNLLNCLHKVIGHTPLVMLYPGSFDGTTLRLFGRIASGAERPGSYNYYRAFSLIPAS
jgi:hypothetical protein